MTDGTGPFERRKGYEPPSLSVPPLFDSRPRPLRVMRWFVFEHLWPQNLLWIGVGVVTWNLFTPDVSRMGDLELGWITQIYARNVILLLLVVGGLHVRLHVRRSQDTKYKYDPRWLADKRRTFLFDHQTRDNMFWSLGSGATVAALIEAFMLWMYANDRVPQITWADAPVYVVVMTLAVFWIQALHFFLFHRLLHWDPLYHLAHYLHHKNVNTGPWTGIAMHPVEHVIYFSTPLVFLVIPGSPFLIAFTAIFVMLTPAPAHSGFDRLVVAGDVTLANGDYFHHLHHRYFECNYGYPDLPLDKWFGTFHDGSPEAHELMQERRRAASRS